MSAVLSPIVPSVSSPFPPDRYPSELIPEYPESLYPSAVGSIRLYCRNVELLGGLLLAETHPYISVRRHSNIVSTEEPGGSVVSIYRIHCYSTIAYI